MDPQDDLPLEAAPAAEDLPQEPAGGAAAAPVLEEQEHDAAVPEVTINVLRASPWGKPGDTRQIPATWLDSATQYGEAELAS